MTEPTRRPVPRLWELATAQPWCITEGALRSIMQILARQNPTPEQVAAELGRPLANTHDVTVRDGVATIPIVGPIFRRANLFTQISGGTSVELLARDFARAVADTSVRGILLSIDSPGGEANGIGELAAMIASARPVKPIVAYVSGMGASAAYWLAAAAGEVVVDASAIVGSIGTVVAVPVGADEGEVEFVSSQSPNKRPDPETPDGRAEIQGVVDAMTAVFVGAVAQYRGLTAEQVIAGGNRGGVLVGQAAVDAGLADRLGSEEQILTELASGRAQPRTTAPARPTPRAATPGIAPAIAALSPVSMAPLAVDTRLLPGGASLKRTITMPEELETATATAAPPAPTMPPPINDAVVNAQVQAYVTQLQAQYEAAQQSAMARAQAEFERKLAEMQARQQIEAYAQSITTPTATRPHAMPGDAAAYSGFLLSLNGEQRKGAVALFDQVLAVGLVSFEEIGSGAGADARSDAAQVLAQVETIKAQKLASGLSQSAALAAAIAAVGKDAYNAAKTATKGVR